MCLWFWFILVLVAKDFENFDSLEDLQASGLIGKDVLQEVVEVTHRNTDLKSEYEVRDKDRSNFKA